MLSCHCCDTCVGGHYHLCDRRQIYSYIPLTEAPGLWGAYSQYMYLAPNTIVHKMDKNLPAELAVMFNPLGAGFRWAVEIPQTQVGDTVLIFGPDSAGLRASLPRVNGAGKIIVTGLAADSNKLQMALALGADHIIDVQNENVVDRVRALTNGKGADVIVEVTSYATQPVRDSLDCVRMGGTVVLAASRDLSLSPTSCPTLSS